MRSVRRAECGCVKPAGSDVSARRVRSVRRAECGWPPDARKQIGGFRRRAEWPKNNIAMGGYAVYDDITGRGIASAAKEFGFALFRRAKRYAFQCRAALRNVGRVQLRRDGADERLRHAGHKMQRGSQPKKAQTRRALPTEKHRPRAALDPRARMQHRPPAEKRGGTPFSAKKANAAAPCLCRPGGSEMPKPKPRFCFVLKCNDAGAAQLPFENTNIARPGRKPRPCDIPAAYAPQSRETPGGQSGRRAAQSRAGHARFAAPPRSPAQRPAETAFAPPFTSAENMSTTQYSTERRRYAPAPAEKRGGTPFSAGKSNAAPYFRRPRRGTPNRSRVHAFAPRRERKQRPRRDEILTGRTLSPGAEPTPREKPRRRAATQRKAEILCFCRSARLLFCRPAPKPARGSTLRPRAGKVRCRTAANRTSQTAARHDAQAMHVSPNSRVALVLRRRRVAEPVSSVFRNVRRTGRRFRLPPKFFCPPPTLFVFCRFIPAPACSPHKKTDGKGVFAFPVRSDMFRLSFASSVCRSYGGRDAGTPVIPASGGIYESSARGNSPPWPAADPLSRGPPRG